MSKRLLAALLAAACLAFALTCCGGGSDSPAPATGLVTVSGASS